MFNEYGELLILLNEVMTSELFQKLIELDEFTFLPIFCMMLEEYAKKHNLDMVDVTKVIHESALGVNEALGKY